PTDHDLASSGELLKERPASDHDCSQAGKNTQPSCQSYGHDGKRGDSINSKAHHLAERILCFSGEAALPFVDNLGLPKAYPGDQTPDEPVAGTEAAQCENHWTRPQAKAACVHRNFEAQHQT